MLCRWLAKLVVTLALSPLTACAVSPIPLDFYPQHGDFTVRFNYCTGERCAAPETFDGVKRGGGWHQITAVHAQAGLEFYLDERRVSYREASQIPFFSAALLMGWGLSVQPRRYLQVENAFRLIAYNLDNGYMADTLVLRGIHRELLWQPYLDARAAHQSDALF